jgi:large repetitive protein
MLWDRVSLQKDITIQLDSVTGAASIIVPSDVDTRSNDACGIASMSVSPLDFTCANVGANTVTLTVIDVNGNSATATATVTVVDDTLPDMTGLSNAVMQLDATGSYTLALFYSWLRLRCLWHQLHTYFD